MGMKKPGQILRDRIWFLLGYGDEGRVEAKPILNEQKGSGQSLKGDCNRAVSCAHRGD